MTAGWLHPATVHFCRLYASSQGGVSRSIFSSFLASMGLVCRGLLDRSWVAKPDAPVIVAVLDRADGASTVVLAGQLGWHRAIRELPPVPQTPEFVSSGSADAECHFSYLPCPLRGVAAGVAGLVFVVKLLGRAGWQWVLADIIGPPLLDLGRPRQVTGVEIVD